MNSDNTVMDNLDNNFSDGLVAKEGLDAEDVVQVQALADEVRRADSVGLKLNWETRNPHIPHQVSDFCYYNGGCLVGYAPLDGDGDELEVTAAVLPSHRQRGVFRLLLDAARQEAQRRVARRLLLVSYPASQSAAAAVRALSLRYVFSEYRMEAEAASLPLLDAGKVKLVQADASNVTVLARLRALSFGDDTRSPEALLAELDTPVARYFLAECGGEYVGQIGVVDVGDGVYIRGFGIVPERRQRGYGRQLLAATVQTMLAEGHRRFSLDVATDNPQALSLYTSCGFRQTEAYDYHDVPLAEPEKSVP
jgi:ribosomal protein S18 acetylase RimI-like enzyme